MEFPLPLDIHFFHLYKISLRTFLESSWAKLEKRIHACFSPEKSLCICFWHDPPG